MKKLMHRLFNMFRSDIETTQECKDIGLTFVRDLYGEEIFKYDCKSIWINANGMEYYCGESLKDLTFNHPVYGKMWLIIRPIDKETGIPSIKVFDRKNGAMAPGACFRLLEPVYLLDGEYYLGPKDQHRSTSSPRISPFRSSMDIVTYEGIINLQ